MTTWARNVGGTLADVVTTDPATLFHPDLAAEFIVVPDDVVNGATQIAGVWTNPDPVTPPTPPISYPTLSPIEFYLAFTPAERIAIKTSTDPIVKEFWATYELAAQVGAQINPQLVSIVESLAYLVTPTTATPPGPGILASTARIAQIQAGIPQ